MTQPVETRCPSLSDRIAQVLERETSSSELRAIIGEAERGRERLDCCDREAMSFVATTSGITGEDVRALMVAAVEHRFGPVNRLPVEIEWLTDNGSCYLARETRRFATDVGLVPCTTPLESPQSNGMAEAFVRSATTFA